ncbi:YccS family putative transporter [Actinobacillus equuli subsp. haemolyticus]|uniref:YccS family putative transporter n=1 Tax=Actinobacillus equuli TaxID=718 RepID=UPI002442AD56|nr:YccS family putative transporter [Actinobacillus equuli]WGE81001.1 YccS family putative transporter [Actinobacillus equuli subsp. haemolyticus]
MKSLFKKIQTDWLSENIIKTLPIFIAINLVSVVVWQLQMSHLAMPLVLGVIAGGLVDLDSSLTGKVKNLALSLVAFSLSTLSAQWSLSVGWLFLPVAMVSTFALVMLGAIGQRYSTIAFGTLIVSVYTCLTYSADDSWYGSPLMILAGALLYGLVSIVVHLCFPNRLVQENLAKAYDALAAYLQAKSEYFDPDDDDLPAKQLALAKANQQVMAAFDQTRVSLFYRLQGQHRHVRTRRLLRYYFTAQDILERASSSHYQYHELFQQLSNSDLMFRFQRVMELQAMACQRIASALRHRESYQHSVRGEKALQGLLNSLNYHQARGLHSAHRWLSIAENLRNIEGQLSQIEQQTSVDNLRKDFAKSARLTAENVSGLRNMFSAIRSQCTLSSQLFRHALRLSLVVFACSLLVFLSGLDNKGYWILLTAIFVCQPNYSATKKRLIQRVIGTMLGVVVGYSFQYFSPSLEAQLGLITLTGSLYYFFRVSNYGSSTFFITLLVFVSLDVAGLGAQNALLPRLFDTLLGTAIAWLAVSFIYPDWKYLNLHQNLQSTLKASGQYLRHILAQLQFGYNDQLGYRVARRDVHNHISALSAVISNMHSEPQKYQNALHFAPTLLGVTYTLLGYISALGAYRVESYELNHHVDFSAIFFSQGKKVVKVLDEMTYAKVSGAHIEQQLADIDQALNQFEIEHQAGEDRLALVLTQQLRLIVQLLPQLQALVNKEHFYSQQH